jgi:hypothetical protein
MNLFYNGNILTMDAKRRTCSAMVVNNGNIIDIGNDEILYDYPQSARIDLEGKTVVPGFFDSHLHLISTFLSEIAIDFSDSMSISDVLGKIKSWKNTYNLPIAIGKRLSEFNLKERRLPTRKELDMVSKDFSLIISSIEFHTVLLNSMALNSLKLPFTSQGFEKDEFNNFTGRLRNRSAFIALKKVYEMLDERTYLKGSENTFKKAIEKGVTTMVAVEGGSLFHDKHPRIILNNLDSFPIDVEILYSTTDIKKVIDCNQNRIGGDIFLDGSFRSQNAALYSPYSDSKDNIGKLFFTMDELIDFIMQAHKLDLQVSVHAVGPRAIDRLLDAYEEVLANMPKKDHRHRIEHFELPTSEQILRASALGLVLGMHPTYEFFFREEYMMYHTRLGKERASKTNPFREIIDSGIIVAGCSDSDVMPIDPMLGIHAAVNHPNSKSRIDPYEALKMYTYNGAYSIFQEGSKGSLEEGKVADFVILNDNPLQCPSNVIKDITVCSTYKNGQCIYGDKTYD